MCAVLCRAVSVYGLPLPYTVNYVICYTVVNSKLINHIAFPPGPEHYWEPGCKKKKKILGQSPDPGPDTAPKTCLSQKREHKTSVGRASTMDYSWKGTIFKSHWSQGK